MHNNFLKTLPIFFLSKEGFLKEGFGNLDVLIPSLIPYLAGTFISVTDLGFYFLHLESALVSVRKLFVLCKAQGELQGK